MDLSSLLQRLLDFEAYVRVIEWSSVTVTALTGVYEARKRDFDFVGVLVIAFVSAVGGGTLRDLLLGNLPVFWVAEPVYIPTIAVVAAVGTAALVASENPSRHRVHSGAKVLLAPVSSALRERPLWVDALDALGLGLFSYLGAHYAMQAHASWVAAPVLGVITAVFGGLLRDLFLVQVPVIFLRKTQLYAVCSMVGSVAFVALTLGGAPHRLAMLACLVLTFSLRMAAVKLDIKLPV